MNRKRGVGKPRLETYRVMLQTRYTLDATYFDAHALLHANESSMIQREARTMRVQKFITPDCPIIKMTGATNMLFAIGGERGNRISYHCSSHSTSCLSTAHNAGLWILNAACKNFSCDLRLKDSRICRSLTCKHLLSIDITFAILALLAIFFVTLFFQSWFR